MIRSPQDEDNAKNASIKLRLRLKIRNRGMIIRSMIVLLHGFQLSSRKTNAPNPASAQEESYHFDTLNPNNIISHPTEIQRHWNYYPWYQDD